MNPFTSQSDESTSPMISARAGARRSRLGRGLLLMAATLAATGVVGAFLAPWSELSSARSSIAGRMEDESNHRFVAPGTGTFELPPGRIFVAYLTDAEFEGTRFITSPELVMDLRVTAADGGEIEVEHEPTQRANLPSSRSGRSSAAVLVGAATIPRADSWTVELVLPEGEVAQAVAEILVVDQSEVETLERAFYPVLGSLCGFGGAIFFGIFGGVAVWLEKRAGLA